MAGCRSLKDKPSEVCHAGVGGREGIVGRQDGRQIGTVKWIVPNN